MRFFNNINQKNDCNLQEILWELSLITLFWGLFWRRTICVFPQVLFIDICIAITQSLTQTFQNSRKNPLLKWNTTGKNNSNVQWTETEVLHLHKGDEEDEAHFHGGSYRSLFSLLRHDTEDTPTSYFWMIFCSCVHLREESSVIMVFLIIELFPPPLPAL